MASNPLPIGGWQALREDFRIIFDRDPAAHHWLEVLCCYPGFHALTLYRFAHWLYCRRVAFIPRLISPKKMGPAKRRTQAPSF